MATTRVVWVLYTGRTAGNPSDLAAVTGSKDEARALLDVIVSSAPAWANLMEDRESPVQISPGERCELLVLTSQDSLEVFADLPAAERAHARWVGRGAAGARLRTVVTNTWLVDVGDGPRVGDVV